MFMSRKIKYNLHIFVPFVIGGTALWLLNLFLNLVDIFGNEKSYVYYYLFSTIVQGYLALVAFLGTLAIFKLQRDENRKNEERSYMAIVNKLNEAQRELTFDLKRFAVACLLNVGLALLGIPFIPLFNISVIGPIYLGGGSVLSIWVLILSYPIIQKVLRLTP